MTERKLTRQDLRAAAEKYKNWGKWGPADEIGTLNYTQPEDIVAAARLVRKGKVISLALNFDQNGPQGAKSKYPSLGRINPVHTMLRTGTDAYSGVLDHRGIRAAGFEVTVIEDACRAIDLEGSLARAWSEMRRTGVRRLSSEEFREEKT